jgi:hypothetical protein
MALGVALTGVGVRPQPRLAAGDGVMYGEQPGEPVGGGEVGIAVAVGFALVVGPAQAASTSATTKRGRTFTHISLCRRLTAASIRGRRRRRRKVHERYAAVAYGATILQLPRPQLEPGSAGASL